MSPAERRAEARFAIAVLVGCVVGIACWVAIIGVIAWLSP